ncbi:MAG: hypothetical protein JO174_19285 [Herbaspirillum sp.]|nr:hypothetical protein [Herbaspirillum sp.]
MMSITEQSATAGVATFLLYGIFPLTVVLYLMGTPQRKRNRQKKEKLKAAGQQQTEADERMKSECVDERANIPGSAQQDGRTGRGHEN